MKAAMNGHHYTVKMKVMKLHEVHKEYAKKQKQNHNAAVKSRHL